nr:lipid II flippase MurJ [Caballeronia sp. BR00000012568055]
MTALKYQLAGWRTRLLQIHPDHVRIARSAIRLSLFVLIGKCAGAFKEMAIAYRFGVNHVVDAYQLTVTLVSWLPVTLVAVLSSVLIPALVDLRRQPKEEQKLFLGELETMAIAVGFVFAIVLWVCWPFVLHFMAGRLSDETRELSGKMMFGMAPIGILMLTICVHAARLQARERHVNTLLECVPALVLLCFVLLWTNGRASAALIWGTTLGFLVQAVVLAVLSSKADHIPLSIRFSLRAPQWKRMYGAIGVFMIGQFIMSFSAPLDQYFVAGLGDGSIAALGYANRVLALILGMGALAISRATLPVLSEVLSTGDPHRARRTALMWSLLMLGIGAVAVVFAWLLMPLAVRLLFQHGAFSAENTATVANLCRWGLVQVPFYFAVLVLVQLLASQGRYTAMAVVAALNFVIKALCNYLFVKWFDVAGVLLSTGVVSAWALGCYLYLAMSGTSNKKATTQ